MTEEKVRHQLALIDQGRKRAKTMKSMAEWPMFSPSKVRVDQRRGVFRWFGSVHVEPMAEVELTREERSELRSWLLEKSKGLEEEADQRAKSLRWEDE